MNETNLQTPGHGQWVSPEDLPSSALRGIAVGARNAAAMNAAREGDLAERCVRIAERAAASAERVIASRT